MTIGFDSRDGLLVRGVDPSGPAAAAGVQRGDLIVAVGPDDVGSPDDLVAALDRLDGEVVGLTVVRGSEEISVEVRFDAGPGGPTSAGEGR